MKHKNTIWLFLFFLWSSHLINVFIWTTKDIGYFTYDSHRHFIFSLKVFEEYKDFSLNIYPRCIALTKGYPPLVGMLTAPFYCIFGRSQDVGTMINTAIFLAVLLFSTFKIGEKLLDVKAGLLSAFIVSMYPVIFNQMKIYMLDLPLTALVTLSIYLLLKCDNFRVMRYCILIGISIGLGMLIKHSYALFMIGPFIYFSLKSLVFEKNRPDNRYKDRLQAYLLNMIILLICAGIICLPYYLYLPYYTRRTLLSLARNFSFISGIVNYEGIIDTWYTPVSSGFFVNRLRAFLWYLWGFVNWQVSFMFFVMFIISLFFFIKLKIRGKGLLLIWSIVSTALVSCFIYGVGFNMEVSAVRFTMPMLPAAAIITALGIRSIPYRKIRYFIIITVVVLGYIQLAFISYPINSIVSRKKLEISLKLINDNIAKHKLFPESIILFNTNAWAVSGIDGGSHPKDMAETNFGCEKIFKIIDNISKNKKVVVVIIPDDTYLWCLQYIALIRNKPVYFLCDWSRLRIDFLQQGLSSSDIISNSDYIIEKIGGWQGEEYMLSTVQKAREAFNKQLDKFIPLREIPWPDGGKILIYKSKN